VKASRFEPTQFSGYGSINERSDYHCLQEKSEAIEHLDFAIKEFRDMKMQPSLERALRHKEILKA
jgi:hypothetical protein